VKETVQNEFLIYNLAFGRNFASEKKTLQNDSKNRGRKGGKKVALFMRKPLIHEDDNVKDITH
jgi:hypothetical protein